MLKSGIYISRGKQQDINLDEWAKVLINHLGVLYRLWKHRNDVVREHNKEEALPRNSALHKQAITEYSL
jgi:hypothetical protein